MQAPTSVPTLLLYLQEMSCLIYQEPSVLPLR
jgi:hypothetical protein